MTTQKLTTNTMGGGGRLGSSERGVKDDRGLPCFGTEGCGGVLRRDGAASGQFLDTDF